MVVASWPALTGVWTQGATRDEAFAKAREAIEFAFCPPKTSPPLRSWFSAGFRRF